MPTKTTKPKCSTAQKCLTCCELLPCRLPWRWRASRCAACQKLAAMLKELDEQICKAELPPELRAAREHRIAVYAERAARREPVTGRRVG